jgi:N-acetylmuramoyl-L-alanine amidase
MDAGDQMRRAVAELLVRSMRTAVRPAVLLQLVPMLFLLGLQVQLAFGATCASKQNKDIVIIVDVGHTPTDPGATSARGIPEYDFNLKLAQRVRADLVAAGFQSTHLMLTEMNPPAGLFQRADRANAANADLFLSIHHDSVQDPYLVPWQYQNEQHRYFDGSTGFSLHVSPKNPQFAESYRWARILADQLMAGGLSSNPIHESSNPIGAHVPVLDLARGIYRRGDLTVLGRTEMPTVLLEAGVIVNRDEELRVSTPAYQSVITTAVIQSIQKLCNPDALYRVTDVAADDVLNIRAGPDADLAIVGSIPPNGRGVRIVGACSGQWCRIDYQGATGWVNRRYLVSE